MHRENPDCVVATETELKLDDIPRIPGYATMVPSTTNSILVRAVMFVRKELEPQQILTPSDIQMVACKVGNTALVGLYRQLSLVTKAGTTRGTEIEAQQYECIDRAIREVSNEHKSLHVSGDINLDPTRGGDKTYYKKPLLRKWLALMEECGLKWAETAKTWKSHGVFNGAHKQSTIDVVYSRCSGVIEAKLLLDAGTDHCPVQAVIKDLSDTRRSKRETRQDRVWGQLDPTALELFLLDWDWGPLMRSNDVDSAVSLLKAATTAAVEAVVPLRRYTTPNLGVRLKKDTRAVMAERNQAKREGSIRYKALRNRALSMIRRDFVSNNLQNIAREGEKAAWRIAAQLSGKEKAGTLPMPTGCTSDMEAAEKCNSHYIEKVIKLREHVNHQPTFETKDLATQKFSYHNVGTAIVRRALKKMQAKPSCGVDTVPILVYKAAQEALLLPIVHIVNLILQKGEWPAEWKIGVVTPILKGNKPPREVSSYRPTVNLCSLSKVVERIMNDQMVSFLEEEKLIPHQQHGFRPGRGTQTALTSLLARIAEAQERGCKVSLAAYDFSSAFDTASWAVLEAKLQWASPQARKLLKSYTSGRSQQVRWNGALSTVLAVEFGVPQGAVLSPLLFLILTSDLPDSVVKGVDSARGVVQYADDSTGYAASKTWDRTEEALSKMATKLEHYSYENGLHLNSSKTQKLNLGQAQTPTSDTLNVLGVTIDKQVNFNTHNETVLRDIKKRLGVVRRLSVQLPRGKLLTEIGRALIVGKLQSCAFVTHNMRLPSSENGQAPNKGPAQVVINDLARLVTGARRTDHIRATDLIDRSGLSTLNEIVVNQSAVAAWQAVNGGALQDVLEDFDSRTRGSSSNLKKATSQRCIPAQNMARAWNSSEALRSAATLAEARAVAKKMAKEARHS